VSVDYRILPNHGLVYVRYIGHAMMQDTVQTLGQYQQDPEYAPGQKQLVDLSAMTGYEKAYMDLMKLQAQKLDVFQPDHGQTLMAYYAPTDVAWSVAYLILKSWQNARSIVPRVFRDETACLSFLGLGMTSFEELLQTA
jgi:hypothetical protein